jgi:tight adherence protein B
MTLRLLAALIFLVTLGLVVSCIYFFVEAPAAKRRLRQRLQSAKQDLALMGQGSGTEAELLRSDVLSEIPFFNKLLMRVRGTKELSLFLQQAAVQASAGMIITISLVVAWSAFLILMLMRWSVLFALVIGVLAGAIPFLIIGVKRQRRFLRFEEQFPEGMDLLARAVRAGHAFTTGLDLIGKEMPEPLSTEFHRTYEQQNLGLPLRDALQNLTVRVPLPDVRIFVTALTIQRESGGNLAEILDNLSSVIRERFKLMRQIRVYTAQGRLTLYFLVGIPPLIGLAIFFLNPEYIARLFTDPLGIRFLVAAILLQVFGFFVIRKITQPRF